MDQERLQAAILPHLDTFRWKTVRSVQERLSLYSYSTLLGALEGLRKSGLVEWAADGKGPGRSGSWRALQAPPARALVEVEWGDVFDESYPPDILSPESFSTREVQLRRAGVVRVGTVQGTGGNTCYLVLKLHQSARMELLERRLSGQYAWLVGPVSNGTACGYPEGVPVLIADDGDRTRILGSTCIPQDFRELGLLRSLKCSTPTT